MARPYTVYKDGHSVSNVYGSELQTWFDQGWSLEQTEFVAPQPVVEVKAEPVAPTLSRQEELEALSWQKLKAIATDLGLEKEEDQSWDDLIPDIIKAENR